MSFYTHSVVKKLRVGDRARFSFSADNGKPEARLGTVIAFVMTGEGEIVRMHFDGQPDNETAMLPTTSVFFVSRP